MNTAHLHFTLRQLRDRFSNPVALAALIAVAVVVGVSGPFGTITAFDLPLRLAYWAVIVPLTYALGFIGSTLTEPLFSARAQWLRIAGQSLGSTVFVCAGLFAVNALLGLHLGDIQTAVLGILAVYVICLAIESVGAVIGAQSDLPAKTPAILARLPLDKRGPLVALAVQDHYVLVTTARGSALVLMRLSDAIAECAPVRGLQVHRSHWVALDQVTHGARAGDAALLTLTTGAKIPVARPRMRAVQQAGLLPHKGI